MQLLQFPEMGKQPMKKNNNRCMDSGQNDDHCLYILLRIADGVSCCPIIHPNGPHETVRRQSPLFSFTLLLSGEKDSFSACFLTYMALSASSKTLRREK